jgi:hypothetical protein
LITGKNNEASHQITLQYINLARCEPGKPHPLWSSLTTDPREIKKACVEAKLLVGQYNLQSAKHHSNSTCPLCYATTETEIHFILGCPHLHLAHAGYLDQLQRILVRDIPQNQVSTIMNCERSLVQVILDASLLPSGHTGVSSATLQDLEGVSRGLLYSLHLARQKLLSPCERRGSKEVVCPCCIAIEIELGVPEPDEQHGIGDTVQNQTHTSMGLLSAEEKASRR